MKYTITLCFVLMMMSEIFGQTIIPKQNEKGLYGFADETGNFVIKPKYDKVHFDFYKGVACVVKGKKYVFINTSGKEISKSYGWASYFDDNDLCLVNAGGKLNEEDGPIGGKYGYVDLKGDERIAVRYAYIGDFNERGVALINEGGSINKEGDFEGGKNGFVHTSGKILIKPKYTIVGEFAENGFAWVNIGGKYDASGNLIGGKFGYVDKDGIEIIAPKYDFIGPIGEDGICWGNKGGKMLIMNEKKETEQKKLSITLFPEIYTISVLQKNAGVVTNGNEFKKYIWTMRDVLGNQIQGGKNGFIDQKGREITKFIYNKTGDFHEGIARISILAKKQEKFGFINKQGKEITKLEYAAVGEFKDGFSYIKTFPVHKKKINIPSKYGFIDETGKQITEIKYTWVGEIADGMAVCHNGQAFGYVNNKGQEIVPFILHDAKPFHEGVAFVRLPSPYIPKNQIGTHLSDSILMLEAWTDRIKSLKSKKEADELPVSEFTAELMKLSKESSYGLIDNNGVVLTKFRYTDVGNFSNGIAPVKMLSKWGYIDKNGKTIIDCKYKEVRTTFDDQVIGVKSDSLWGGIDLKGEEIIPVAFDSFEDFSGILQNYIERKRVPLSDRDIEIYRIRKKNLTEHFNIILTIPNEYWDY